MEYSEILDSLRDSGNFRILPEISHEGKYIVSGGSRMLNLSSNDYLGIMSDGILKDAFLDSLERRDFVLSSSSSRLLTGNFGADAELEKAVSEWLGTESSLVFSSGYHMNTGILPAVTDSSMLILADKLVHASLIDGIRLSYARCIRYRHQDMDSLERLVHENKDRYSRIIIVTESIFSMDGDVTDLSRIVALKRSCPSVMIYVDEAHAAGVRGSSGAGVAQEQECISGIDFLCGTFGKALASVGAYAGCSGLMKSFLVNRMRTLIFTTALPPLNLLWTLNVVKSIPGMSERRKHLAGISCFLRSSLREKGLECPSESHIVPIMAGESRKAAELASKMRTAGFYLTAIRPPTVPEGTSRLRISLTSSVTQDEVSSLADCM